MSVKSNMRKRQNYNFNVMVAKSVQTTIFLMVDNVSSHQSLKWEKVFFVKKICYNLTVSVTLYYTLANIDPYSLLILTKNTKKKKKI